MFLSLNAGLLSVSIIRQSPTLNEPAHLLAGIHYWRSRDFSLYRVNPPLIRMVASAPAVCLGYEYDWEDSGYYERPGARPVFNMAERFVRENGRWSITLIRAGRAACLPFSMLGALVCFWWARDLFGSVAGVVACGFWCFSPMFLAHSSYLVPDAHATAIGLAACFAFWRWLKRPSWCQALITGVILGFAELSKTTMVLFYPVWPLAWIAYRWPERNAMPWRRWRDEAGMLALRMLVGLYILNLGYFGQGSFTKLKEFQFVSQMFAGQVDNGLQSGNRFAGTVLGEVPVPLPSQYLIGIDVQQRCFEDVRRPSYLRGKYEAHGWWYYYLYAIAVKAPLGTLALVILTVGASLVRSGPDLEFRDALILLAPAIVILAVASSKSGFSHHSRYMLPCIPFVFIWLSGMSRHLIRLTSTLCLLRKSRVNWKDLSKFQLRETQLGLLVGVCLLSACAGSLSQWPNSISYFNAIAGGSNSGPEHLLCSNIDWGQDLLSLERWIEHQDLDEGHPVHLAFCNYYNPLDLEIESIQPWPFEKDTSVPEDIPDGYYAISVNLLYEFPWPVRHENGRQYYLDLRPMGWLRSVEPIARSGDSIRIFSSEQVRDAYAAPRTQLLWEGFDR